ncbi:MAG: AraC family transcriptional regulator [Spirochaetales bacterium]|nr:AraC family transcriptional regulator [Spirochaetales bacterium]
MEWIERMNTALKYIEDNLLQEPDTARVAYEANSSEFHFQRMFRMLTGYSVAEYVRNRRLSLAAQDILTGREKVIDIAFKYGYESPESFSRAFSRLHGVSPRDTRKENAKLKLFSPLSFHLSIKGDVCMDYRIKTMKSFYLTGKSTKVTSEGGRNFKIIPDFWKQSEADGTIKKIEALKNRQKKGVIGNAMAAVMWYKDTDTEDDWSYLIGVETDGDRGEMETVKIPARTWAIFESVGPMPDAIQDVWKRIFSEWFPSSNYEHDKAPELEIYPPCGENGDDYYCEVWIPVVRKK